MKTPAALYFVASGLLFALAFAVPGIYLVFVPAFVLLFVGIRKTDSTRSLFVWGSISGFLAYLGAFSWVWSTFPLSLLEGSSLSLQIIIVFFYWSTSACVMGIVSGLFSLACKYLQKDAVYFVCFVPLVWVFSELLKALTFSIYFLGSGGYVSVEPTFGYVGYLLASHHGLLQLSVLGGVYALSYVAVLLGVCTYLFIEKKLFVYKRWLVGGMVFVVVIYASSFVSVHQSSSQGLSVVGIDTNFDRQFSAAQENGALRKEVIKKAVQQALVQQPDVIVLPESVRLSDSFSNAEELFSWIQEQHANPNLVIVDNGPSHDARGLRVIRTYLYDVQEESVYFVDKRFLVPQGEYLSNVHAWALSLFTTKQQFSLRKKAVSMFSGIMEDSPAFPARLPGVLFCFETLVPYGVTRAQSYRDPSFIAHSVSHAWFTKPHVLEYELETMMRIHAVWNNIPIVTAGNMADGALYKTDGTIDPGVILEESEFYTLRAFAL